MQTGPIASAVARYRGSVSLVALLLGCVASSPVLAASYFVSNETELRNAITAANASPDASSTITLNNSFAVSGTSIPALTKPITFDTQGFTLSGIDGSGSIALNFSVASPGGAPITFLGTMKGADSATAGQVGLGNSRVGLVNHGSIIGGNGGTLGGGAGIRFNNPNAQIINYGTIQGGNSTANSGGAGVDIAGTSVPATLINSGTIRGGNGPANGSGINGVGVAVRIGVSQIINSGTIEGGVGAMAMNTVGATTNIVLVNSGIIRAGAGQDTAIQVAAGGLGVISLELQDGSQIFGKVVANATRFTDSLTLSGSAANSLDISQYQNFDTLDKTGAGTWTVTGAGDLTGPTNILGGRLVVNGSLAGSAVTVQPGATLEGSGTVGATTIAAGGAIAPGNSIGTLTINGAYSQAAGATYQVEVDPATATSDLIKVNGTATLAPGAGLSVVNYTGTGYSAGQRYTILTSTGLTGDYGTTDITIGPILSLRKSTDATNVYLTVIQTGTAGGIGGTGNEVQVGHAVDSLPTGNAVQSGVYSQPSIDAARRALNQLSGEIHASAKTALIEESWLLRAAMNDRLRSAFGSVGSATLNYGYTADLAPSAKGPMPLPQTERFAVWGQGYGSWGRSAGDGNAATLKRSTGGFLLGADAAVFDNLRFGIVAGYSRSDFDIANRLSSGESDNYHLGLYGGGQWGALALRAGASYSWHDVETRRAVTSAFIGSTPRANYDAGTAQLFGELGYRIDLGRVAFEPFAGLAYVHLKTDDFNETGAVTALQGWGDSAGIGYSTLGLRASTDLDLQGMAVKLRGGLAWRHAFGDTDPKTTLAFTGSNAFTIGGLPIARDAALVEAGLDVAIGRGATLGVSYTGQLAEDAQDHAFKGVLAVRF